MTTIPGQQTEQAAQTTARIVPENDSRLAQLLSLYPNLKTAADDAARQLKDVTDAIKAELAAAGQGSPRVEVHAHGLQSMALVHTERWTLDAKRMKAENPLLYVQYAKKGESWTLKPLAAGGEG